MSTPSPQARRRPYVGPRPFRGDDSDLFFGRGAESYDLASLWVAGDPVILHGPRGSGKTSLLNAGVLPRLPLEEPDADVLRLGRVVHSSTHPLADEHPHNTYGYTLLSSWARAERPPPPGTTVADYLRSRPARLDRYGQPVPVFAAIDQFEELFTDVPDRESERDALIDQLAEVVGGELDVRLLICIRDDRLADLTAYLPRLGVRTPIFRRLLDLRPDAAVEAVRGPAELAGRPFEPGAAERLVDGLRTFTFVSGTGRSTTIHKDSVTPIHLQIVCETLWSSLPVNAGRVSTDDLTDYGGVDQALVAFYDAAVEAAAAAHRSVSEREIRDWLESEFITDLGTRANACRGLLMTGGMPNEVADTLVEEQVLVTERRALATWYQLGQDHLVTAIRAANAAFRRRRGGQAEPRPGAPESSGSPAELLAAAENALGRGDFRAADAYAGSAVDHYSASGDDWHEANALAMRGMISRVSGDYRTAESSYRSAARGFDRADDDRAKVQMLVALAEVFFTAGDYEAAADEHRQALRTEPGNIVALTGLAYTQWLRGRWADARATFARALEADPGSPLVLTGLGQVLVERPAGSDDPRRARRLLAQAVADGARLTADELADARSALALAHLRLGEGAEAERQLARAEQLVPGRPRTLVRRARAALDAGDRAAAAEALRAALAAEPPLPEAHAADARRLLAQAETPE
ncbi:tetratricopeptide repeat protein [Allonocardiopsis opalescens]|uniref:Tfp pilus assembly protein PilF n=1 Tax=Allonocardiopsis opalescens TaxID=1144618 RepID=A0A2T0Q9M1_9ACTN|nr:tetratricopeptide repeat protein [Allonocardiopsis opalescens]PRY00543.1 Tfp pilus assembly protein PilF [Allonocardiopsis opalescens]